MRSSEEKIKLCAEQLNSCVRTLLLMTSSEDFLSRRTDGVVDGRKEEELLDDSLPAAAPVLLHLFATNQESTSARYPLAHLFLVELRMTAKNGREIPFISIFSPWKVSSARRRRRRGTTTMMMMSASYIFFAAGPRLPTVNFDSKLAVGSVNVCEKVPQVVRERFHAIRIRLSSAAVHSNSLSRSK